MICAYVHKCIYTIIILYYKHNYTMVQNEEIFLEDPLHQYCCSWLSLQVANVGTSLFVASWNAHPIPGTCRVHLVAVCVVAHHNQVNYHKL